MEVQYTGQGMTQDRVRHRPGQDIEQVRTQDRAIHGTGHDT